MAVDGGARQHLLPLQRCCQEGMKIHQFCFGEQRQRRDGQEDGQLPPLPTWANSCSLEPPGQGTKPAAAHPRTRNSWRCFRAAVIFSSPLVGYQHVEPKRSLLKHSGEPFIFLFQFNWIVQTNKPNGPIPFPVTAVPSVRFTECFRNYS